MRLMCIVVVLFVIYVSDYFALYWLAGRGIVEPRAFRFADNTIFWPIEWFASSSAPTTPYIRATAEWCYCQGSGKVIPWNALFDYWEGTRTGHPIPVPRPAPAPAQ